MRQEVDPPLGAVLEAQSECLGLPHDVVINAKIVVHDLVSHPDDVRPSDVRMIVTEVARNLPRCLADGLYQMNQGETKVFVGVVSREIPRVLPTAFLAMSSMCPT